MAARIAINGFGRVGMTAFRAAYERGLDIDWVAINDLADAPTLAYLLKYDSVYGPFPGTVEAGDGEIHVDGVAIPVLAEPDPSGCTWAELSADIVIESTGRFRKRADASRHLDAGASKVVISAPATDPDVTVASVSTSTRHTTATGTRSSRMPRAPPTVLRRSRRCSMRRSGSATA